MNSPELSRRGFIKASAASALALGLARLGPLAPGPAGAAALSTGPNYEGWRQMMAGKWTWDNTAKVTHCVDCYPGQCSWTAYVKDGMVIREEQTGHYPQLNPDLPDMNPRGCQKGASFSDLMYADERLRYPLVRVGKRGGGRWKRASWNEALGKVADAMITAQQESGPESCVMEQGPGNIGIFQANSVGRFATAWGMTTLDVDGLINDFNIGQYITFGKFHQASSVDDWFNAEVVLIWHKNPIYTRIPSYHFISEARYRGATVVTIAPDASPSTMHADMYVPVDFGSDAALALGMAQVMMSEGLVNERFVKEQTDLALLVRDDNGRFLRASELEGGDSRDDQFYFLDPDSGQPAAAALDTLELGELDPALDARATVTLHDGSRIAVRTVYSLLREQVNRDYTPEQASKKCGTSAETIRRLARMIATRRSMIIMGWNSAKYYHGDLIERAQSLVLALSGNWGTSGTGNAGWNQSGDAKNLLFGRRNLDDSEFDRIVSGHEDVIRLLKKKDPTITDEMAAIEFERIIAPLTSHAPPVFYWYHHAGYREVWNNPDWGDPGTKRSFDEYYDEAMGKGWWDGLVKPAPEQTPRVLIGVAGSTLRRTRGGLKQLLSHTWPRLDMVVSIDPRMSTTCMYSDVVLPPAWFYEREDFRFHSPSVTYNTFTDRAVEPLGNTITEWEIMGRLSQKIVERGRSRGVKKFERKQALNRDFIELLPAPMRAAYRLLGGTMFEQALSWVLPGMASRLGVERSYRDAEKQYSKGQPINRTGYLATFQTWMSDQARLGLVPADADLGKYRREGFQRMTGLDPMDPVSLNTSCDIEPDKPIVALQWHVRDKVPYPTIVRRAQFYIDHEWFIEAGEALPVHKDNPKMGGDHPFRLTSGHMRWSVHSIWVVNKLIQRTHRGRPGMFINPKDASAKGLVDGDMVEVFNDFSSFKVHIITSSSVRPGQLVIYHAWEPYQFPGWKSYDVAIPGMVKYLHLAGGYGQLRYWRWNWQPVQSDRAVTVDLKKTDPGRHA
ncbi:MAG: molybdopterin-dependent oxidoreductase [Proteobacteria bacterium]|nr:molybdopterin-dependent oxidoreductase [Pseudomonadota bacterium]